MHVKIPRHSTRYSVCCVVCRVLLNRVNLIHGAASEHRPRTGMWQNWESNHDLVGENDCGDRTADQKRPAKMRHRLLTTDDMLTQDISIPTETADMAQAHTASTTATPRHHPKGGRQPYGLAGPHSIGICSPLEAQARADPPLLGLTCISGYLCGIDCSHHRPLLPKHVKRSAPPQTLTTWPLQDILSLRGCCAQINNPVTPPRRPALPTLVQYYCTIIGQCTTPLPTSRLYAIHHTILVIPISCEGQLTTRATPSAVLYTAAPHTAAQQQGCGNY